MKTRIALLAGIAAGALLPLPALAQDEAAGSGETANAYDLEGVQLAQAAAPVEAEAVPQNVIIITARRRQEAAQEVPLAISTLDGRTINETGNFSVQKIQQLTPTLQVYSSNPRNTSVNIRGLGVPFGLTSDGFEQGVGIYVDDVYNARVASAVFDFLDVAQVEILRGPQGTLYGKNTTAGAINVTTNQPSFTFEGSAEVTVGNLGFKQAKAAISGPLSDTIAARLAVSGTSRRGTIFNVATGNWINEQDNIGVRGQVLLRATDELDITLAGDYSKQNPECCGTVFVRTGATQRRANGQYDALSQALGYEVVSRDPFDRLTDVDANLNAGNIIGGVSLRAVWDVGPGTLTSISAWRFWDWKPENDRDFTGLPIVTRSQNPSQQDQYSQELRYNYSGDAVDFVLGAFAFKQRIDTQGTEAHGPASSRWTLNPGNVPPGDPACGPSATNQLACDPTVLDGLTARNTQYLKATSLALFGQLSWHVTDQFTIQPGVRLNYDKKSGFYQREVFDGQGVAVTCPAPAGDIRRAAQCGVFAPQLSAPSGSDWNLSYDLTLSYEITPEVLAYGTYAKTFKTFGINQNGLPTDSAGNPIEEAGQILPESVNHFEAGLKTQLWDRRVTFNLSAFRTDIKNYQATVFNGQLGVLRGYLANAGKVRSQGIEADFSIRPSDRLVAYVNGAYTDAKYVRFVDAPCPPELAGGTAAAPGQTPSPPGTPGGISAPNCDISGQRLPGVSKWALSFGAEGNVPVTLFGKDGEAYLGYDGSYRSDFSSNPSPSIYSWVDGYSVSNFRVGFRTDHGFNIYGWVRNAFDEAYFDFLTFGPSNTGLVAGQPGDPRTWGGTVRYEF